MLRLPSLTVKVVVVHNRYRSGSPGGEDRVVDQEGAALDAAGHVVERFEQLSDDIERWSPARKALVPARVVWSDSTRRSLVRLLRTSRPDIVHVHSVFPLMSPSVLYACRAEAVPVVATVHHYGLVCASGTLFRDGAVCHDCVGRLPVAGVRHGCYRGSALATTPLAASLLAHRRAWRTMVSAWAFLSAAQRDLIAGDGFPPERLFVKHNFVDLSTGSRATPEDIVVFAGRLTAAKGVPFLMDAWDRYAKREESRLRLVVAGVGPLEDDVRRWAASRPSVEWRGMLDRDECASLMASARACVVPSQWEEPFGLVVAESMAAGVPPIASSRGSLSELVTDGVDGVLVPPGDASRLAEVFVDVETHPGRYQAMGEAGRRTAARRFSRRGNIEELVRIYRFAVENPIG